jgi:hypothetical protein
MADVFAALPHGVKVLPYGDEPMIEPGELLVRLILEAPEGQKDQEQARVAEGGELTPVMPGSAGWTWKPSMR